MGYAELLAQLQANAAKTKERRDEASLSLAQAAQNVAAQAAEMVPNKGRGGPGRNSGGGGPAPAGKMVGLYNGQPAEGDVNVHSSGYNNYAADINVPGTGDLGNPVSAYKKGTVIDVKRLKDSYGKHIKIKHPNGTTTLYAHLSGMRVKPGQRVKKGQMIGRVGNTGNSSGPHLHFEIR